MTIERFPVEATHIMMFARAIGDPNPVYNYPDSPEAKELGGVAAPPTFAMAGAQFDPDNPLRPRPGEPWFGSGREPSGDGETWEKQSRRGGLLRFEERITEYRDATSGELVVTARMVGVRTERPVDEEG